MEFLKSTRVWVIERCIFETFSLIIYCRKKEDMFQEILKLNIMPSDLEQWEHIKFKFQGLTYSQAEVHWK